MARFGMDARGRADSGSWQTSCGDGRGESQMNDGFCDCGMNKGGDSAPIP